MTEERVMVAAGICKQFGQAKVLSDACLEVRRGETVAVIGPSGSGKTTLLRCLNLLVTPDDGELTFCGAPVGRWGGGKGHLEVPVHKYRSQIGMVFQHFELFPHLSALHNVMLGPVRVRKESRKVAEERAHDLLARVGLGDLANRYPRTMSGGQQQRVAIARALAMKPELLLFDEPTSALDSEMVGEVLDIIEALAVSGGTLVVVTHELAFAQDVADRVIVMDRGVILEEGPTAKIFGSPASERTRAIVTPRPRGTKGV